MLPDVSGQAPRLPAELSSFVGRRSELRQLRAVVSSRRLVTLTGVGGVGKTRLALRVAAQHSAKVDGRVWFVELAPVTDHELVVQAVASRMGLRQTPGTPSLATVIAHLRERPSLLVLDNCEHLVEAA